MFNALNNTVDHFSFHWKMKPVYHDFEAGEWLKLQKHWMPLIKLYISACRTGCTCFQTVSCCMMKDDVVKNEIAWLALITTSEEGIVVLLPFRNSWQVFNSCCFACLLPCDQSSTAWKLIHWQTAPIFYTKTPIRINNASKHLVVWTTVWSKLSYCSRLTPLCW